MVGYIRRNFMVPKPRFESFDALNASLADQCLQRQSDVLRGHKQTIGDRFVDDKAVLCALPKYPFEACEIQSTRVSSLSMVRYRGNDYSVPVAYPGLRSTRHGQVLTWACWGATGHEGHPSRPARSSSQEAAPAHLSSGVRQACSALCHS